MSLNIPPLEPVPSRSGARYAEEDDRRRRRRRSSSRERKDHGDLDLDRRRRSASRGGDTRGRGKRSPRVEPDVSQMQWGKQQSIDDGELDFKNGKRRLKAPLSAFRPNYKLSGRLALDAYPPSIVEEKQGSHSHEPSWKGSGIGGNRACDAKDQRQGGDELAVVPKHHAPANAALPDRDWRLFVFDGTGQQRQSVSLSGQETFLFGTDGRCCDIVVKHHSVDPQHAVIVFREIVTRVDEVTGLPEVSEVRPCVIDLETVSGTIVDGKRIRPARYVDLLEKDTLQFGSCAWRFILLLAA